MLGASILRLLVAEDDTRLRELLGRGLQRAGCIVDLAARGDDALELAGLESMLVGSDPV